MLRILTSVADTVRGLLPGAARGHTSGPTERRQAEAELRHQNKVLQEREEELRRQNRRFEATIANLPHGLSMIDAQGRLLVCNKRYVEMYDLPASLVTPGTPLRDIFDYLVGKGRYSPADAEEYRREGLACLFEPTAKIRRMSDGRIILITRGRTDGGWISIHDDITEREKLNAKLEAQNKLLKRHEAELEAQNANLDVALANMAQGLAMFDADERLVLANDRYADIYGLRPEHLKPGTTLHQLVEHRIASGLYPNTTADEVVSNMRARVALNGASHLVSRPGDGCVISVSVHPRREGGWVVTLQDITERQRLNARLEEQNRLLKQQEERLTAQNVQLDAALENMLQGLAMYDSERRLVVCNKRYAEMYGLAPEQVLPGTPLRQIIECRMANGEFPGKSADELVEGMVKRVAEQSVVHYTGQLSGGRYIAVSVQPTPDGGTVTTHHDITEQRRSEARIAHMALHDTLTGLPNRVLLNERLEDGLRRVKRGDIVAMHLLDLDHFKTVNDSLGHPAGDKLLKTVADRLRALVRETDTIARMGGDEFAIVQTAIAQPADATSLAHRAIEAVNAPYLIEGHQVVIGTSVGIAVGPSDGGSPEQLIRNADLALYRAKGDGRSTYRFFEPGMDAQMQVRRSLEDDLRKALSASQFEFHYQPVVNLAKNEVCGFEALIRWRHPEKGLVGPSTFIPLAEEIGFIVALGEWCIREACATAAKWPGDLRVAVNLSPAQFRNPGLVHVVVGALAASGLAPGRLELEITENTLLQDTEATLSTLYQLRALGVRIAMDDFGTGYSSLSYLQSFPFDKIKIDRSFVKDIADGVGSLNIVRAVAAMATGLGMETTAEGVETKEQLAIIKAEGCTEMQGYLFSRPLPAAEVDAFLRQHGFVADKDAAVGEAVGVA